MKQKLVGVAGPARVTSGPKMAPSIAKPVAARVTSAPKAPPRAVAPRQTVGRAVATRVLNGGRSRNR